MIMKTTRDILRKTLALDGQMSRLALSKKLGKNPNYIQQFLERGTPKELPLPIATKVAEYLNLPIEDLLPEGLTTVHTQDNTTNVISGFKDDAIAYQPPASDQTTPLFRKLNLVVFTIQSRVLDECGLNPRDRCIFDMSSQAIENVAAGDIVLAQLVNQSRRDGQPKTLIRQFLPPRKLVTNCSSHDLPSLKLGKNGNKFVDIRGVLRQE